MKNGWKNRMCASLKFAEVQVDPRHLQAVFAGVHKALYKRKVQKPMGFAQFLACQVKYIALKIWVVQGLVLTALYAVLGEAFGGGRLSSPKHVSLLLCFSVLVVLMTAIPFIQRSQRYKMQEVEAATRFSRTRLLAARLLIIGLGNGAMLAGIMLLALHNSTVDFDTVVLSVAFPFMAATGLFLYALGHVPAQRLTLLCGCIAAGVFVAAAIFCYLVPQAAVKAFSINGALIAAVMTVFCVSQVRYIFRCAQYAEMQLV